MCWHLCATWPVHGLGEDAPSVFSGSLVVHGHGLALVLATGSNSELGKIGKALGDIPEEPTRLHAQTRQLVKLFGTMGLVLSVLVMLFYGLQRGDWLAGALSGITLAMAILPEEFPLILTFFMAMGAWRISKHQVLTRQSATIETLVWLNLKSKKSNGQAHRRPSRGFLLAVFGTGLTLLLVNTVPALQSLFKFATLSPTALGLAFASGVISYVLVLLVRRWT